ncbi:MAG: helix-turn-helix domain-containing protein [Nitrospirales bacterium]
MELHSENLRSHLLAESAVADQLACETKTLQAWRCRGGGPAFVKVGRLVRYRPEDVLAYIESRRVSSTSER